MAQMEKVQHELQKKKMFRNQEEINEQRTRIMEFMVKMVNEKGVAMDPTMIEEF